MESNLSKSKLYVDFDRNGNFSIMEMDSLEVETLLLALKSFIGAKLLELNECENYKIPENISELDIGKVQRRLFLQQSIQRAAEIISKVEVAQEEKTRDFYEVFGI